MSCFIDTDAHQFVWQIHLFNISEWNHQMFMRLIHAGAYCVRNHVTKTYLYLRKSCNSIDDPRNIARLGALVIALLVVAPETDLLLYRGYMCMRDSRDRSVFLVCIDLNPHPSFIQACLEFPAMSKEGDKLDQCRITSTLRSPAAIHCKKKLTETFRQSIRSFFCIHCLNFQRMLSEFADKLS